MFSLSMAHGIVVVIFQWNFVWEFNWTTKLTRICFKVFQKNKSACEHDMNTSPSLLSKTCFLSTDVILLMRSLLKRKRNFRDVHTSYKVIHISAYMCTCVYPKNSYCLSRLCVLSIFIFLNGSEPRKVVFQDSTSENLNL